MSTETTYQKEIKQEYEQIRFRNRQLHKTRLEEVHQAFPRIAEIDDEIRDLNIDAAIASLHNEDVDPDTVTAQTNALIAEKYQILTQAGYPSDYLAPIYTCPKCKDTGYTENERCDCFKQKLVARHP